MRRIRLSILMMTTVLALAACAGAGESGVTTAPASGDAAYYDTDATAETAPPEAPPGETLVFQSRTSRKVIHRAAISIEANDTRSVYDAVQALVDKADGFVESATVSDTTAGEDQPRIHMVIRVPAADLPTTLDAIAGLGTRVVSQSQSGEDVTEHYVDTKARVENLTLLETELRELLADVRNQDDADPAKLLAVFNEISRVRGEIEMYQGQLQVLDDLTSLATIEVSVVPAPAVTPVVAEGWAPLVVAREALGDLVSTLQGVGDFGIRFVVYVLPIALVVIGIPALLLWRFSRSWSRRRPQPEPTTEG